MTSLFHVRVEELLTELRHFEKSVTPIYDHHVPGLPPKECLAFVVVDPLRFMFSLGRVIASDNLDTEIVEAFDNPIALRDMQGRFQIVYFPYITIEWME